MRNFWFMIVFVIACYSGFFFYAYYYNEYGAAQTSQ